MLFLNFNVHLLDDNKLTCVRSSREVFNLCHAVDPTEIPSSGGGPHGPRRTGFNLSYSWLVENMSY